MKLSKTRINIGLVRYADHYHTTNEASQARWLELLTNVDELRFLNELPRGMVGPMKKAARQLGFELHFFEKGLGR